MALLALMFRKHILKKNMVWYLSRPRQANKQPSTFGEIAIANVYLFFSLGLAALYLPMLSLYICKYSLSFNRKEKNISRLPYWFGKKKDIYRDG